MSDNLRHAREMRVTVRVAHRIGGAWNHAGASQYQDLNPARPADVVALAPVGTVADAGAAVAAARRALPGWARLPGPARADILDRGAALLAQRAETIAAEIAREEGKTLAEALGETRRAAAILRYFAGRLFEPVGEVYASASAGTRITTVRQPVGVVGLVTPWNFPIAIPAWKIAPALAYGNTVVVKPATATPLTAFRLVEALVDAGLPAGVLNLVFAPGAHVERAWLRRGGVDALSFTGSSQVGRRLQRHAVRAGIKVQLELGGKNAAIVAPDADIDLAARHIVRGAFGSAGQRCTATSRVLAIGAASEPIREAIARGLRDLVAGDPLDQATTLGPVIDQAAATRIKGEVDDAVANGARIVAHGTIPRSGAFSAPILLDRVHPRDRIARTEVFGPVVCVIDVPDLKAAVQAHEAVEHGLSAAIFTRDLATADTVVHSIRAGVVHVNGETGGAEPHVPFGGMKGSSSWSREQGPSAEEFYTQTKTIYWEGLPGAGLFDQPSTDRGGR